MEVVRHWRMGPQRLKLSGYKREMPDGTTEVSLSGNSWVKLPEKTPIKVRENIIYQADAVFSSNGHNKEALPTIKKEPALSEV